MKIFAHYMICFPTFTDKNTAKKDILYAQSLGIDGFAVNVNIVSTPGMLFYLDTLFDAATGTGFKLFLSLDMTTSTVATDIFPIVSRYAKNPNYMTFVDHYITKVLVSTFSGESFNFGYPSLELFWNSVLLEPMETFGTPVFFVPNFWRDNELSNYFQEYNWIDGIFNWRTVPSLKMTYDLNLHSQAFALGKVYMAAITPWFSKHNPWGNWMQGIYHVVDRWLDIINTIKPEFLEIVTWNDFSEGTHIGTWPAGTPTWPGPA